MKKNLLLILSIFILSSCYTGKIYLPKKDTVSEKRDNNKEETVVIINIKPSEWLTENRMVKEIELCESIKTHIDSIIKFPAVYSCNPKENIEINMIKDFKNSITIDLSLEQVYNYTLFFEAITMGGLIYYIPVPHWGHYILKTDIVVRDDKFSHKFNYTIESDFSYLYFSYFRYDAQRKALNEAFKKLLSLITEEGDLRKSINRESSDKNIVTDHFILEEKDPAKIVQRDQTLGYWGLNFDLRMLKGYTTVDGYKKGTEDTVGASGDGELTEYNIQTSSLTPYSYYYITPNFGFFYRDIKIKDFGLNTSSANEGSENFIPGVVTDPETGEPLIENVYSLEYNAEFYSFYVGIRAGFNLVFGSKIQMIFNPTIYLNLFEIRHSTINTSLDSFSGYSFPFASSYGFEFETGFFIPSAHMGIKFGFNISQYRKFELPGDIEFKEPYFDYDEGIYRNRRIYVDKAEVTSILWYIDLMLMF